MSPHWIANLVFWGGLVSLGVFVYQAIILPSIRLQFRYQIFELRDQLRRLVIEEKVKESDKAFQLLHDRLNAMCTSLHRVDLVRVVRASNSLDEEGRTRVANYVRVMESAPAEIQRIYKESLNVFAFTLMFNSIFFFIGVSVFLLIVVALKASFRTVKDAGIHSARELFRAAEKLYHEQVDADTTVAFFSPELAVV